MYKSLKADSPTPFSDVLSTGMAVATSSRQLSYYEKLTGHLGEGTSYAQMTRWRRIRLNVLCTLPKVLFSMKLIT